MLTTNRPDLLEAALAQRPGRVDLAVEVPLPDDAARLRLARLYARELPFSAAALGVVADRTEGCTASFFKELFRRTVLVAAEGGRPVSDPSLTQALDDRETLTRALLGSGPAGGGPGEAGRPGRPGVRRADVGRLDAARPSGGGVRLPGELRPDDRRPRRRRLVPPPRAAARGRGAGGERYAWLITIFRARFAAALANTS